MCFIHQFGQFRRTFPQGAGRGLPLGMGLWAKMVLITTITARRYFAWACANALRIQWTRQHCIGVAPCCEQRLKPAERPRAIV